VYKKDLQRRANHRHITIVGKISPWPARTAGFFNPVLFPTITFGSVRFRTDVSLERQLNSRECRSLLKLDSPGKSPPYIHHRKI
jgi:hypothetical protein